MSNFNLLPGKGLNGWRQWYRSAEHLAWRRRHGWTLFLPLVLVPPVYAITFQMRHPGHPGMVALACALTLLPLAAGGFFFFMRNRW